MVGSLRGIGMAPTAVTLIRDLLGGESQRRPALIVRVVISCAFSVLGFVIALRTRHASAAADGSACASTIEPRVADD